MDFVGIPQEKQNKLVSGIGFFRVKPVFEITTPECHFNESYLTKKTEAIKLLDSVTQKITRMLQEYETAVNLQAAVSNESLNTTLENPYFIEMMKRINNDAEDHLQKIYAEVVKAYEYTTLESFSKPHMISALGQRVQNILQDPKTKSLSSLEKRQLITSFYRQLLSNVIYSLDDKFRSTNPILYIRTDALMIHLNPQQVSELNNKGTLELELTKDIYLNRQKSIRLADVSFASVDFESTPLTEESKQYTKTALLVSHSGFGQIENSENKIYDFTYENAFNLYTWGSSFQLLNGKMIEVKNKLSKDIKGILGLFIKDTNNTLYYTPIFAQPAGITKLIVRKESLGFDMKVKDLVLKIDYTYTQ